MLLEMLIFKLHRVTVTDADLNYMGSITIDQTLMDAGGILPGQKVQVVNNNNGQRFETYVMAAPRDSGIICLNGAAARLAQPGDKLIIIGYALAPPEEAREISPKIVFVDDNNAIINH